MKLTQSSRGYLHKVKSVKIPAWMGRAHESPPWLKSSQQSMAAGWGGGRRHLEIGCQLVAHASWGDSTPVLMNVELIGHSGSL